MDNQKIGTFIKQIRKEKGYTQKDLAKKLNITDRAISKWERGLGCPDISLLEELSKILDISILEILKGEKINDDKINKQDLLDSMTLSKQNTINKIKNITNKIAIISTIIFIFIIFITNLQSLNILTKNYHIEKSTKPAKDYYQEYNEKVNIILNNQGIFTENDYIYIASYTKIMQERLEQQNNKEYINKTNYTYKELLQFYNDHNNIYTIEIDNLDLYQILLKYDTNISNNMITYSKTNDFIKEMNTHISSFLEQPYFIENKLPYDSYTPNPDYYIKVIYEREIMLLNDIIKVGDLNDK